MGKRTPRILIVGGSPVFGLNLPGLDARDELLQASSHEAVSRSLFSKELQPLDGAPGVVFDGFIQTDLILRIWLKSPESIAVRARQIMSHPDTLKDLFAQSESSQTIALEMLALASCCSSYGWPCLIVLNSNAFGNPKDLPFTKSLAAIAATRAFGFRMFTNEVVGTALWGAVSVINSLQCLGASRFTVAGTRRLHPYECPDLHEFLAQWQMEEYEHDDVIRTIRTSVGRLAQIDHHMVFLRAVTLVRLMATRSFEHHECNARILLTDKDHVKELKANETFTDLYRFSSSPTTWFHRADMWLLESGIETALSENSVLAVDRESGEVLGVYEFKSSGPTRFESLLELTCNDSAAFIIAAMKSGYVEIYHKERLLLWYDRYRWRSEPFLGLVKRLTRQGMCDEIIRKILGAISTLMDNKESSILVFPDQCMALEDLRKWLAEMRPEIRFRVNAGDLDVKDPSDTRAELAKRSLAEITSLGLASILRLDGAHVVSGCELIHAAELITFGKLGSESHDASSTPHQQGSGRTVAFQLSRRIYGFVAKVSSSGELRLFDGVRVNLESA